MAAVRRAPTSATERSRAATPRAVAGLVWIVLLSACEKEPPARSVLMDLAGSMERRPSPGRLIGERRYVAYARAPDQRAGGGGDLRLWRRARERVRQAGSPVAEASGIADRGVLELLSGDAGEAVLWLERAVSLEPSVAHLSDLAAAYLARADAEDRVLDLLRAADAARRAVELGPDRAEPAFNLAVALDRLHLPVTAAAGWRRLLDIEPSGRWAGEARERLAAPAASTRGERWRSLRALLLGADPPSPRELREAVAVYPYETRRLVETGMLAAWTESVASDDRRAADFWLQRLRQVAGSLSAGRGDSLHDAEARRLESLAGDDRSALVASARAYRLFLAAAGDYAAQRYNSARPRLEAALPLLRAEGSELVAVTELRLAVCDYYGDLAGAADRIQGLLARLPEDRPVVRGQALWMLGIVATSRREFERATALFERALPLIERAEGPTRAATLRLLMAEALDSRGEIDRGWRHRLPALAELSRRGDARRRYGSVFEAAQALARHGRDELALVFLDEAVTNLGEYGAPAGGAEVHLERARIQVRRGRAVLAREEVSRAARYVAQVEAGGLRDRLEAKLGLTRGVVAAESRPSRAIALLSDAHGAHKRSGYRFDELVHLLALADAQRAAGEPAAARATLERAVESYEESRRDALRVSSSIASMRLARAAFDQLIELSLGGDPEEREAFAWAERGRARTLLELRARTAPLPVGDVLDELRRELAPDTVVVEYVALADRLVCWVISADSVAFRTLEADPRRLDRAGAAFARGWRARTTDDALEALGAELYEELIAPLELDLSAVRRLIVVPDGALRELPLAALLDVRSGRYLIEDVALATAPSATLLLLAVREGGRRSGDRALVVGAARPRGGPYGYLPELEFAEREARSVAALFPGSTTLLDEQATPERVVAGLGSHDLLHYSGHAIASAEDLAGTALVLSPSEGSEDGLLRLTGILGLPTSELRLVTLSACSTLAGYDGEREGTVGLAAAFFAAGVPSVLGTLWPVDDRFSHELMRLFYARMENGGSAAEALRSAVVEMRRRGEPARSWAAFSVVGI